MRSAAISLDGYRCLSVFSDVDLFLHSACHLFHEGEFDKGVRDLTDLEFLLREFSLSDSNFLSRLASRADLLGLGQPLFLAMRYTKRILGNDYLAEQCPDLSIFSPSVVRLKILDFMFDSIFVPYHSSCTGWQFSVAKELLYWRGHLLRMPLKLLIPHLLKKTVRRISDKWFSAKAASDTASM